MSVLRIGNPHLAAVDNPASVLAFRKCLDPRGIDPAVWLGDAEAHHQITRSKLREILLLHLLRTMMNDRTRRTDVIVKRRCAARATACFGDLMKNDAGFSHPETHAAVLFGHDCPKPPGFRKCSDE